MKNQLNKALVWSFWQAMNAGEGAGTVLQTLHPHAIWHGFVPLRNLDGAREIWREFWQPLRAALPDLSRRTYIFLGGEFQGEEWVCGTGDFTGTFINSWLGIPPSGSLVHFRFGEFCRIVDGKIAEIRMLVDLPELARQSGIGLVPPSYGADIWVPGPVDGGGILHDLQDAAESARTLQLVEEMIFGGLNSYNGKDQASQNLERYWHPAMTWYGPVGIGTAYGREEFKRNAQGPIVHAYPDRKGVGHQARLAEGQFAASTGWPSLVGTHQNEYLGWAPTGRKVGWNIMDFWRREGSLLLENWVLVDLIAAAAESGHDLLATLPQLRAPS